MTLSISDTLPRPVEVDAARLLVIIYCFAKAPGQQHIDSLWWPSKPVSRYLTPEYYLQKIDFLVRYPAYLAYELIELHRLEIPPALDRTEIINTVRTLMTSEDPDLHTNPFRRFFRGAYESLDRVEAWWASRQLVLTTFERRGAVGSVARPYKYYLLTPTGEEVTERLIAEVELARWYHDRAELIRRYFGGLSPTALKELQYSHPSYRDAQLNEWIPDLPEGATRSHFENTFNEPLVPQTVS